MCYWTVKSSEIQVESKHFQFDAPPTTHSVYVMSPRYYVGRAPKPHESLKARDEGQRGVLAALTRDRLFCYLCVSEEKTKKDRVKSPFRFAIIHLFQNIR